RHKRGDSCRESRQILSNKKYKKGKKLLFCRGVPPPASRACQGRRRLPPSRREQPVCRGVGPLSIRMILEALSSHDYRVTWQRWAVAAHIALKGDKLFTVEELFTSLRRHYPN